MSERLQILVENARRRGVEIIIDDPDAQWTARHAEWIQKFLVKGYVGFRDGGKVNITPHEAHTGDNAPNNVVGFLERVLVRRKNNDDTQPRFLIGWALGHRDADIITLVEDGSVIYNRTWKYGPEGRSETHDRELQDAGKLMKNTKPKRQG